MRFNILVILILSLTGCQTTSQATFNIDKANSNKNTSTFVYTPGEKEQFAFNEKTKILQQFGYKNFCQNTKSFACRNNLSYDKYLGMKGYFNTENPVKTDYTGHDFYPVVLENGEKYYYVSSEKYGGKYGKYAGSKGIISLDYYKEIKSFKKESLVPKSDIVVVSRGSKYFELSNGMSIKENDLKLIREVSAKYNNNQKIAELLLNMHINKDEIDSLFFISPKGKSLISEAKLYIVFNEKSEWLRFKVKYYGNDWLFVNSYKVAADNYRWKSPKLLFKRENSSGSIWEWSDVIANDTHIEIAKRLANSEKSIIRFQGDKYNSDKQLSDYQKTAMKNILKLFDLMKDESK